MELCAVLDDFLCFVLAIDKILGANYINLKDFSFSNYILTAEIIDAVGLLTQMYRPLAMLPFLVAISRKLHDINKIGWWCLLCAIPFIIVLIFFPYNEADEGENKYEVQLNQ